MVNRQEISYMSGIMLENYFIGNDIVYGVRNNRDTDSIFKKC